MNVPGRTRAWILAAGLVAECLATPGAAGQPAEAHAPGQTLLAAAPDTLWLLHVESDRTRVYRREVTGTFGDVLPLNAPVRKAVAGPPRLYVFTAEGRFFSLSGKDWSPELDLPARAIPVDIAPAEADLFAIAPSPPAGALPRLVAGTRPAASQPFEPGEAPLSLLRYDHRGWAAVAACPDGATVGESGTMPPRLAVVREHVCLVWWSALEERLVWARLSIREAAWSEPQPLPVASNVVHSFWVTPVGGVVTLVVAGAGADGAGGVEPAAYRLLAGAEVAAWSWRATPLELSTLPADVAVQAVDAVAGFNQHLTLLVRDRQRQMYVRFGRIGGQPAEPTLAVRDVIAGRLGPARGPQWLQTITMLALFAVLFALIVLRRGAMVQTLPLPVGVAPALAFQRLVGLAVDLVPFAVVFAGLTGVNLQAALRELFAWAIGQDAAKGGLPPTDVLIWWGATAGAYIVYAAILELVFGRTIGKVVTGTRVLSESGKPAGLGQIAARNLLRGVELLPPMWVLSFLVVLSRNRQRMGDIFSRTVVVRRVPGRAERDTPGEPKE